ncbi:MAG: carboxypeptidase regulatory-like domain-containing protein, partial [Nitrosomonas sp.]|nr:carboxypeptidase regulatory-like domain-containing protein [Nitrosomonas sp.]
MDTESNKSLWSYVLPTIESYAFAGLVFIAITLTSPAVWGETEKAEFSLHVFQEGLPIEDAELMISSESFDKSIAKLIFEAIPSTYTWKAGDAPLKTNANGSIAGKLPPGLYQFTIKAGTREFMFDLPLRSAENAQILVTFFPSKKKPLLNIESSLAGTVAGTDAASVANQGQGEGTITVQVVSAETGKSIKDVQIFLSGSKEKLRTDEQGKVTATVPAGNYSISLLHSAFSSQTQDEVKIENAQTTDLNFKLTPAGVELAEYVVLEPHLAGTVESVIEEQRTATSVATVLGAEQFSRAGDS